MPNPEITFPSRYTTVNAVAYAKPDGSAELVALDKPLPVSSGALTFALLDGSQQSVSATAPLPVSSSALPASTAHIGNVFVDDVPDGLAVQGSVSSAATVVSSSLAGYGGGTFHVIGGGSSCTISYEQSNDGTNWAPLPVISASSAATSPSTSSTTGGIYAFASSAGNVRARVSTYGSGTVTAILVLKRRPLNVSGTSIAGGSASIGNVAVTGTVNTNLGYTDSTAALAASATFTGTGRANNAAQYCFFNATAFADVAGTMFVDQSLDSGASYQPVASGAVAAGGGQQLSVRLTGAFAATTLYRVRYVNGAAAQGTFRLSSAFSAR